MKRPLARISGAAVCCLAIVLRTACAAGAVTPASLDSYPAVYQELDIEHQIAANGADQEIRRARVRIQSETGAAWFARITVPIRSRDAGVRIVSVSVRPQDGAERRLDVAQLGEVSPGAGQLRVYSVPDVHAGDEIVYEVHVLYRAPARAKWWLNLAPVFDLPVRSGQWTVATPKGNDFSTDVWNDKDHRETQSGIHVWKLTNAAAEESPKPWFGISTFATWNEVGDWLRSQQPVAPDATVQAEARRLTAGKARSAVVETLYARVAQGVRSLDRPLADSEFRARAPAQTLAEGEGDAISKHVLLAALVAAEGIRCDAVFVNASATLDIDFPSPGQLDRVVSWVQNGNQSTWLDAGLGVARAGALMPDLRGRRGLVVTARGSRLVQVPPAPPGFNRVRAIWSGKLKSNGNVDVDLRVELRGDSEAVLRAAFRDGDAEGSAELSRLLMPPFAMEAQSITHSPIFDLHGPLVVEMKASIWQFLQPLTQRAGAVFQAVNYGQGCQCTPKPPPHRDPPALKPPYTVEEVFELKVPDDLRPILPPSTYKSGVAGTVRSSTSFAGGVLRLNRTLEMRSDSPEAQQFAESLLLDSTRSQVFEHIAPIDVDAILKDRSDSDLDSEGYDALDRDPELARVILEYATRRNPESRYSWNNLGRVYEALGRNEDAFKAYDRQIEVNPKDEWAYNNRGRLLSGLKRDAEAIPWFEHQLQIVPDSQFALRNLGHSYLELQQWQDAETYLKRALAVTPEDSQVLVDLGQALSCGGDLESGKAYFAHATRLCPPAASDAASVLAKCGVGLEYAREQAESGLKTTQEMFDITRALADWPEGVAAQAVLAASLEAFAEVLLKTDRAKDAARFLDAAGSLAADEDIFLDIRDAQIALGNLRAAAQAQSNAQQMARDRKLAVPPAIALLVSKATPEIDGEGWRRLEIRRRLQVAPHAGQQAILACSGADAVATRECTILDGDASLRPAVLRDAALVSFPRVDWRNKPEKITHLIRLVYRQDGGIEASEAASLDAIAHVRRLMPNAKPAAAGAGD